MFEQTNLSVEVRLNEGDMYRYSMTTLFRRFRWITLLYTFLTIYLVFQFSREDFHWSWSLGSILAPVFFFIIFPYTFFVSPYFSSKKYLEKNPNLRGPYFYTFSSEGIDVSGVQSKSHSRWGAILEARETPSLFLLYPQTAVAHVIPKRFFPSTEEQAKLRDLLRANVQKVKLRS